MNLLKGSAQRQQEKMITPERLKLVVDRLGVEPTELQQTIIYDTTRTVLVAGGERGGKSWVSGLFAAARTSYGRLFWIVGPDYEQTHQEFEYWVEHLDKLGAFSDIRRQISMPKQGPWIAETKTGQKIQTKTSDDIRKLASVAPHGIIMSEAAQQTYETYLKLSGRVAENRGWLLMSGTFEESGTWFVDLFNEWQDPNKNGGFTAGVSYSLPTWSNHHIFPGGRRDPEILRLEKLYERVPGLFEERMGASPSTPTNVIFKPYRRTLHVTDKYDFDPKKDVYLAIDPSSGGNPYSVLAVQFHDPPNEKLIDDPIDLVSVFDEIYEVDKIGEQIIELAKAKPWYKNVVGGAIDIAAPDERKRWLTYGNVTLLSKKISVLEGIRRLLTFLHFKVTNEKILHRKTGQPVLHRGEPIFKTYGPHLAIHPRVKSLPFEFVNYKRAKKRTSDSPGKDLPPRDAHNHSVKALWYLLILRYGFVKAKPIRKPVVRKNRRPAISIAQMRAYNVQD